MINSFFYNDDNRIRLVLSLVLFSCLFTVGYVYASSVIVDDNIKAILIKSFNESLGIDDNIKASVIKASSDHTGISDSIKVSVIKP